MSELLQLLNNKKQSECEIKNSIIKKHKKERTVKTKIEQQADKYFVTLAGEMDTAAAAAAEEALQPLYSTNGKDVIIDCTDLEYIASSGLRILISILKGAKAGGSRVVLKNVNEDIQSVFKLTGFINIFEFE